MKERGWWDYVIPQKGCVCTREHTLWAIRVVSYLLLRRVNKTVSPPREHMFLWVPFVPSSLPFTFPPSLPLSILSFFLTSYFHQTPNIGQTCGIQWKDSQTYLSAFKEELTVRESDIKWQSITIQHAKSWDPENLWALLTRGGKGHSPQPTWAEQTSFRETYPPMNRCQLTEDCSTHKDRHVWKSGGEREWRTSERSECEVLGEAWCKRWWLG